MRCFMRMYVLAADPGFVKSSRPNQVEESHTGPKDRPALQSNVKTQKVGHMRHAPARALRMEGCSAHILASVHVHEQGLWSAVRRQQLVLAGAHVANAAGRMHTSCTHLTLLGHVACAGRQHGPGQVERGGW